MIFCLKTCNSKCLSSIKALFNIEQLQLISRLNPKVLLIIQDFTTISVVNNSSTVLVSKVLDNSVNCK